MVSSPPPPSAKRIIKNKKGENGDKGDRRGLG